MAIRFVDSAAVGGNDGTTWADAFTSLNTAISATNHSPGDQYLVSGTFNETVTIAEVSTASNPTVIQGDDKSGGAGVGNPATFTIDGQSTRANCLVDSLTNTPTYYVFKNMRITGATGDGQFTSTQYVTYKDCRWDNNGADGCNSVVANQLFERCEFDHNTGTGCYPGSHVFVFCSFHDNGDRGVLTAASGSSVFSVFYGNGGPDYESNATNLINMINCTFDGNSKTSESIRLDSPTRRNHVIVNCIVDNTDGVGGVGINCTSSDVGEQAISANNLLNNNTTNYNNCETFSGEVLASPGFTNQATNDYTLTGSGSADGAGADGSDAPIT